MNNRDIKMSRLFFQLGFIALCGKLLQISLLLFFRDELLVSTIKW